MGDGSSKTLMVSVLMLSLSKSYSTLIVSLYIHHDRTKFDFVVQHCMNEEAQQATTQDAQLNSAFHVQHFVSEPDIILTWCGAIVVATLLWLLAMLVNKISIISHAQMCVGGI